MFEGVWNDVKLWHHDGTCQCGQQRVSVRFLLSNLAHFLHHRVKQGRCVNRYYEHSCPPHFFVVIIEVGLVPGIDADRDFPVPTVNIDWYSEHGLSYVKNGDVETPMQESMVYINLDNLPVWHIQSPNKISLWDVFLFLFMWQYNH